jgi:hypothetical protein
VLAVANSDTDSCSNVRRYLGGITERPSWFAILPKAVGELHKRKQCCRWLGSGMYRTSGAAVARAYAAQCGSSGNHPKAD